MAGMTGHALEAQRLEVRLAKTPAEVEEAMRLRYEVFVEEEGREALRRTDGLEQDAYDAYCDHLIVQDTATGGVVGTYRLLPGARAMQGIGFYSESEFDLEGFTACKSQLLELGRSCIHPDYRGGRAIQLLWEGIAAYLAVHPHQYLIGCASAEFGSREELAEAYSLLRLRGIWTDRYGIQPLPTHRIQGLPEEPLPIDEQAVFRRLPPLLKGYQWLGAEIGGDPAYDAVFGTVDFLVVLDPRRMSRRYRKHFLGSNSGGDLRV